MGSPAPFAEEEVLANGHVGKQEMVLKHDADAALLGRKKYVGSRVHQGLVPQADDAIQRPENAGDERQDGAFAAARGPEERGDAPAGGELGIQLKAVAEAKTRIEVQLAHVVSSRPRFLALQVFGHTRQRGRRDDDRHDYDARARLDTAGGIGLAINEQWDGLRFAGDIARDHDGGAELPKAPRKARMAPAMMPRRASGTDTSTNVSSGPAPSVRTANSRRRSTS